KTGGYKEAAATVIDQKEQEPSKTWIPEKYQTSFIMLLQVLRGEALAIVLGDLTGINYSLWALAIGIVGAYFGFYNNRMLDRSNAFGIPMVVLIIYTLGSMSDVTPGMFIGYIPVVLAILVFGVSGVVIGDIVASTLRH